LEEWSVVASDHLLIDLPAEVAHHLNNFIIHIATLFFRHSINSTECITTVHVNPDFFETLLFLHICLPELVLLLEQVVVKDVTSIGAF